MTWEVITGDCLAVMPTMEANSVDTVITDPPYGLSFMGKDWDHGVPGVHFWREALRVAKPGALLLAFGGTRTFHRLAVAIEDAGWEIRDTIMWLYGSGFPKSHDISKAIDKAAGAERTEKVWADRYHDGKERQENGSEHHNHVVKVGATANGNRVTLPATPAAQEWSGYGTALKPAFEPIIVAMKPLDGTFAENAQRWGVAGMWIDGGRVPSNGETPTGSGNGSTNSKFGQVSTSNGNGGNATPSAGRWPSNILHDGSAEVLAGFPVTTQSSWRKPQPDNEYPNAIFPKPAMDRDARGHNDTGSAARFFYCAKASRSERNAGLDGMEERSPWTSFDGQYAEGRNPQTGERTGQYKREQSNHHPTVKPLALMRYLARLTKTPTGGVILDPFAGSGSTGCAAVMEGRDFIGIDIDEEYTTIARARCAKAAAQAKQMELQL